MRVKINLFNKYSPTLYCDDLTFKTNSRNSNGYYAKFPFNKQRFQSSYNSYKKAIINNLD